MLRASRDLVAYACVDGQEGTADAAQVTSRLTELEALGLLTHRDFAQEYRIWRGSDFDLNTALQVARRTVKDRSTAALLTDVRPMPPLVAGRHSTRTGTVRAFERSYADATIHSLAPPPPASVCDGLLVYRLEDTQLLLSDDATAPVVVVDAADLSAVAASAIELAALLEVAEDPSLPWNDLAARRELAERTAHARMSLDRDVTAAFAADATWTWINAPDGERVLTGGIATSRLSQVLDEAYAQGPARVAYESINRAELTSAGAKARRTVQNAVVDPSKHAQAQLGLEGDGAEVAVYRAVLLDSGVHDPVLGVLRAPTGDNGWARVWQATLDEIQQSDAAVSTDHLLDVMMSVPYGLREGTASLLLTALLVVEAPNLAVYEHGTFTPRITGPLVERLVRNPKNFAVKHLGTARKGRRWKVLTDLNRHLDDVHVGERPESITVLSTVRRLAVAYRAGHSTWSAKTRRFTGPDDVPSATIDDAVAVRKALTEAREPDVLLFGVRHICGISGGKDSSALALTCDAPAPSSRSSSSSATPARSCPRPTSTSPSSKGPRQAHRAPQRRPRLRPLVRGVPWGAAVPADALVHEEHEDQADRGLDRDDPAVSYVAIRADESNRKGYVSTKPNISAVFPFIEEGIDHDGVMRILDDAGIGLPSYYEWRTRSGCYFCFYQRKSEWVGLADRHPELFERAKARSRRRSSPTPASPATQVVRRLRDAGPAVHLVGRRDPRRALARRDEIACEHSSRIRAAASGANPTPSLISNGGRPGCTCFTIDTLTSLMR
jgi:hypothetical protein